MRLGALIMCQSFEVNIVWNILLISLHKFYYQNRAVSEPNFVSSISSTPVNTIPQLKRYEGVSIYIEYLAC